jgi:hypothetical protein
MITMVPAQGCPGRDSNPYGGFPPGGFKPPASAISPPGRVRSDTLRSTAPHNHPQWWNLVANCIPQMPSSVFGGSASQAIGRDDTVDHVSQHGRQRSCVEPNSHHRA